MAIAVYIQPTDIGNEEATQAAVLHWCRQQLPSAAVPVNVQLLQQLPTGPAGKLTRTALPAPAWAQHHPGASLGHSEEESSGLGTGDTPLCITMSSLAPAAKQS